MENWPKNEVILKKKEDKAPNIASLINVMNYPKRVHENKVEVGSYRDTREVGLRSHSIIRPSQHYCVKLQGWENFFL